MRPDHGEQMNIDVPRERIEAFCRKWHLTELALFGSVLRDDFRDDSDVDVLVTFQPGIRRSLFDRAAMIDELTEIFGRDVDLAEKAQIVNPFIRKHVLAENRVIYAA
ncbi:MAG TPA: nucleotidyltransferase domain-containing protein [Longimicrobium sp.]|nr:nucleotidyltransferase domain-containing protein [Longimicrobium sp.]